MNSHHHIVQYPQPHRPVWLAIDSLDLIFTLNRSKVCVWHLITLCRFSLQKDDLFCVSHQIWIQTKRIGHRGRHEHRSNQLAVPIYQHHVRHKMWPPKKGIAKYSNNAGNLSWICSKSLECFRAQKTQTIFRYADMVSFIFVVVVVVYKLQPMHLHWSWSNCFVYRWSTLIYFRISKVCS